MWRPCGSSELERSWRGSDEVARARLDLRTPAVGGAEAFLATLEVPEDFAVRLGAILKLLGMGRWIENLIDCS